MKPEEGNKNEKLRKKDNFNIKLNYDYNSFENIILSNQKQKPIDLKMQKKDKNITLNQNLLNNINQNELKSKSLTEMPSNKNTEANTNLKNGLYQDLIHDNDDNNGINEAMNNEYDSNKRYIQTTRNNIRQPSNMFKDNIDKIEKDFKDIMKQKDSFENILHVNDLVSDSNEKNYFKSNYNNKKSKKDEETKDFQTMELISKKSNKNYRKKNNNTKINKLHEEYLLTNEDLDFDNNKDIKYMKKNITNLRRYKSNPKLNIPIETYCFDDSEDNIEKKDKDKKDSNFIIQNKFDLLYKAHFILKKKYEILKNNMNILQKSLKQKNYDISQMKKVLLSNNQQINFLSALKDSNLKTIKDNEDLITNLKKTITNLNSKIIDYKTKLSSALINGNYNTIKNENESLKIYLNERDKTINTLKNSLSFLTQNLDIILNNPNENEINEKIINECEQKIKSLKEQMNQKLIEFNNVKNQNLEEKYNEIQKENENINQILKEKNLEIEKYKDNIKELNENIKNKNQEINEIKNKYEIIKKNLELKESEIEGKNKKINELNNNLEKKNNEIKDLKKLLDIKNLEIEERTKKADLQIINQSSLEFYRQVKKYEVDIKNKKNYLTQNNIIKIDDINNLNDNNSFSINSNKINSDNNFEKNKTNTYNKFFIKKIKNSNLNFKNNDHLNKELLFNDRHRYNNKSRIKTNFDYFNNGTNFENEPRKTTRSISNLNYRKNKNNKNFNTIIKNNLLFNQTSNENINKNKDSFTEMTPKLKFHLFNNNDEDIKKIKRPKKNNRSRKTSSNLLLSTSTLSVSQNENIKSMTHLEKSPSNYDYIYSLINSDLISFNLKQKKFEIIKVNDNTKGVFTSYISHYEQNKLQPLQLNTKKYFYIIMHKYIFYYESSLNSINILAKSFSSHLNGKFIQIENNLYLISGNDNVQCELYSLITNKIKSLPNTNFPRINSGICNVNNEYIYIFFGQFCENSIERLNIKNLNFDKKWEIIRINEINRINNNSFICLEKCLTFLDDYNNIIIFGGHDYNNQKCNKNIFGFNLDDNSFSTIGKIDSCALYGNQYIKLDESIFAVFDEINGLHFFNKELDYHEIFNLNL